MHYFNETMRLNPLRNLCPAIKARNLCPPIKAPDKQSIVMFFSRVLYFLYCIALAITVNTGFCSKNHTRPFIGCHRSRTPVTKPCNTMRVSNF